MRRPERLARHLFDAGVLLGFDIAPEESLLRISCQGSSDVL